MRDGTIIQIMADISSETREARRQLNIFEVPRGKKIYQSRILYPAKTSFKNEGEIKIS